MFFFNTNGVLSMCFSSSNSIKIASAQFFFKSVYGKTNLVMILKKAKHLINILITPSCKGEKAASKKCPLFVRISSNEVRKRK